MFYILAVLSQLTWLIDLLHCPEFISVRHTINISIIELIFLVILFVKKQQNTNILLPELTLAQFYFMHTIMQNKVILIVGWGLQYEFCKKY